MVAALPQALADMVGQHAQGFIGGYGHLLGSDRGGVRVVADLPGPVALPGHKRKRPAGEGGPLATSCEGDQ